MKITIPILVSLSCLSTNVSASDESKLRRTMESYWEAYSTSDYESAAQLICSAELDLAKKELLPVFLAAGSSTDTGVRWLVDLFFSGIPTEARSSMAAEKVYVGLHSIIAAGHPDLVEASRTASIQLLETELGSPNSATVTYRLEFAGGVAATDIERFSKLSGEWCLRLKEDPRDVAVKFKKLFEL